MPQKYFMDLGTQKNFIKVVSIFSDKIEEEKKKQIPNIIFIHTYTHTLDKHWPNGNRKQN
jgi:hypothetical protein